MQHDTLIVFGGEVKALDDTGKVGGYLVRFSGPNDPDLVGDFFTKDTDFGTARESPVLYHHGQDATIKSARLGHGTLKVDGVGVWLEGQLELRNEYEEAIFEMAKQGKLGWSSGTASHLVEREAVGKSWFIKSWPLGLDASLTPTPCEPRTKAIPLKSYLDTLSQETEQKETATANAVSTPVDDAEGVASTKAMSETVTPQEQPEPKAAPLTMDSEVAISMEDFLEFKRLQDVQAKAASQPEKTQEVVKATFDTTGAPAFNSRTGTGDSYLKAASHYFRTGDTGGIKHYQYGKKGGEDLWEGVPAEAYSIKASNDTDMNIGTAVDGGNAVPTGHYQRIIARRDESDITTMLGVQNIPGKGTTVNVPVDNEDDGEFISTAEAAAFDRDAPALGQVAMTLVKYTKRIQMSDELMLDEDSAIMSWITDFIGRGAAKTRNNLLVTEVAANGTNFLTLAGAAAVADGEIENIEDDDDLGAYLEEGNGVGFIMRNSTLGAIRRIGSSGPRPYQVVSDEGPGVRSRRTLIGYPVYRSNKVQALGATNKPILFGNFNYVGVRNNPEFRILRDPYSNASTGQFNLHIFMRVVFKVLQAEAVGYATNAAS